MGCSLVKTHKEYLLGVLMTNSHLCFLNFQIFCQKPAGWHYEEIGFAPFMSDKSTGFTFLGSEVSISGLRKTSSSALVKTLVAALEHFVFVEPF